MPRECLWLAQGLLAGGDEPVPGFSKSVGYESRRGDDADEDAFLLAVQREPATANGVWASKMMWNYFSQLRAAQGFRSSRRIR